MARIGGQAYLFLAEQQSVLALSDEAAAAWPHFEVGMICEGTQPCRPGVCSPAVAAGLLEAGAIEPLCTEEGPAAAAAVQMIDTGAGTVLICYGDAQLQRQLAPEFAHMETPMPQPCGDCISVQPAAGGAAIALRDGPAEQATGRSAVPELKIAITEAVLDQISDLLLHAALLHWQGRALLLAGGPGAGKSTLAAALGGAGFALAGDDLAALDGGGLLRALPFPVTLKTGSWELLEGCAAGLAAAPVHVRPDAQHVRYLPVDAAAARQPLPAGWIVFLDRQDSGPASLSQVSAPDTLSGLIGAAWSGETDLTPEEFSALAACLDRAACVRLRYSDLPGAVAALQQLCRAGTGQAGLPGAPA